MTKNVKRLPSKAESMQYNGKPPEGVKIFDPGKMATLFKPEKIFVYEENGEKVGFVYREYTPGDDLLIFDKGLIARDHQVKKALLEKKEKDDSLEKKVEKVMDLTTEQVVEMFELNAHDIEVRNKTLQLCCVEPVLTDEIIALLSDDCKDAFYDEIMKGVRANSELVQEFPEEGDEQEA